MTTHYDLLGRPDFRKFPKIPRLNRDIIITEKIDGTNAQILINEDGQVFPGSRNRYLRFDYGADNHGFAAWVKAHEQELLQLGPGRHFGEWWGKGINRGYGLDHKRFSLFNVSRWVSPDSLAHDINLRLNIPYRTLVPGCCHVVPILGMPSRPDTYYIGGILEELRRKGSVVAPGFMQPEGIVIYHTASNYLFKVTVENDEKWKGKENV